MSLVNFFAYLCIATVLTSDYLLRDISINLLKKKITTILNTNFNNFDLVYKVVYKSPDDRTALEIRTEY